MTRRMQIDKLVLDVPGLTAAEARRLAELVGAGLGEAAMPLNGPRREGSLALTVKMGSNNDVASMARVIVARLLAELGRSG
jgi:hypothetical protein